MLPDNKLLKGSFTPSRQPSVAPVSDPVTRVIVIGAGYSGIAAANALKAHGVEVVVLEGRSSIGGRTKTVPLAGANVEAGGAWIHAPIGNPLSELADFLSLPRRAFPLSEIYNNLKLASHAGKELDGSERDRIMGLVDIVEEELMDSAFSCESSQTIAEMIEVKLLEVSDSELREWINFILTTGFEADLACAADDISMINYTCDAGYQGEDDCIVNGYSAMLELLAKGCQIHCESVVSEIEQTSSGVTVRCANGRIENGSHVILSVPLGVLKSGAIKFSPALSSQKRFAIEQLGFGCFEKLVFQFNNSFWKTAENDARGILIKDHPIFPYWVDVTVSPERPTLAAHVCGPKAIELSKLDDDTAFDMAMSALSSACGGVPAVPVAWHRTNWLSDPFSCGAYTHIPPSVSLQEIDNLGKPEGRLLFAGEATSAERFGYVDGAYISGLREAQRLTGGRPVKISVRA
ncbi:FAD-dependent oxidoreductase [Pseudomonas sp. MSSRFD41]|uniref:flavin monoamine oxidase family protein n=1 Tax=Pseudomonas sp. MSSRFD41 TaxID=1310370 RepID=UPI00163ABF79|nr:NAD(P)/FAD-dependent oxidoreductase [Pseudomonas sp. MSSRFD41]MBC2658502.1 FAD-dependent oxidoreductase [Pseudomonas sp. MSSRFD41]